MEWHSQEWRCGKEHSQIKFWCDLSKLIRRDRYRQPGRRPPSKDALSPAFSLPPPLSLSLFLSFLVPATVQPLAAFQGQNHIIGIRDATLPICKPFFAYCTLRTVASRDQPTTVFLRLIWPLFFSWIWFLRTGGLQQGIFRKIDARNSISSICQVFYCYSKEAHSL